MVTAREWARTWPPVPKHRALLFTCINGWFYQRADHELISMLGFIGGVALSLFAGPLDGHQRAQQRWPQRIGLLDKLEHIVLVALSAEALRGHADHFLDQVSWWWMEVVWFAAAGRTGAQVRDGMKVPGLDDPTVLFVGNDSLMLEAERALRRAAHDATKIEDYRARFGHMVESADPIHPTLRESPEHLAWQLAAARRGDADPDARLARARTKSNEAEAAVRALKGWRGRVARNALAAGQSHAAHTDDAVFHFQRVLALLCASFFEAGRQLAQAGKLAQAHDTLFLERDALWTAGSMPTTTLSSKVADRRARREAKKRLVPPPFIPPISDPLWARDPIFKLMTPAMHVAMFERGVQNRNGRRVLVGSPSSPGRARGVARVVRGPEDPDRFQMGDVLVARMTSPIWTPLLGIAAVAVTEAGGQFAHAAIVAREFGIPLVDGATDATRVIADGTSVLVDGSARIVDMGAA